MRVHERDERRGLCRLRDSLISGTVKFREEPEGPVYASGGGQWRGSSATCMLVISSSVEDIQGRKIVMGGRDKKNYNKEGNAYAKYYQY